MDKTNGKNFKLFEIKKDWWLTPLLSPKEMRIQSPQWLNFQDENKIYLLFLHFRQIQAPFLLKQNNEVQYFTIHPNFLAFSPFSSSSFTTTNFFLGVLFFRMGINLKISYKSKFPFGVLFFGMGINLGISYKSKFPSYEN